MSEMNREELLLLRAESIGSEQGWVAPLTHKLTHNRKRAGGDNGAENTVVSDFLEQKGPQSAGKRHIEGCQSVGKDEVSRSSLDSSSIKVLKSTDFGIFLLFFAFYRMDSLEEDDLLEFSGSMPIVTFFDVPLRARIA